MFRPFLSVLVFSSALLATACEGSSGGGGGVDQAAGEQVRALRHELAVAGIQPLPEPPPVSDALFQLGQALFFDKILSGNQDVSCATCHLPEHFTGDGRTLADGIHGIGFGPNRGGGVIIPRNSPPLFALHLKRTLFWDGRAERSADALALPPSVVLPDAMRSVFSPGLELLAAQAMLPPVSREEMRGLPGENPVGDEGDGYGSPGGRPESNLAVWNALTERLLGTLGYQVLMRNAYPRMLRDFYTFAHVGNAIAAFETRAFARTDSPFERFVRGDDAALTPMQVSGALEFFGRAGCSSCHSGSLFTDQEFHNTGLPQLGPGVGTTCPVCTTLVTDNSDIGRENVTGLVEDRFRFRTPSLLNVELTGPYGHAGQFAELRDFVAHYRDAVVSNLQYDVQSNVFDPALVTTVAPNSDAVLATLDPRIAVPNDFDVDAVVEFLRSLTAPAAFELGDIVPQSVPSGLPIF